MGAIDDSAQESHQPLYLPSVLYLLARPLLRIAPGPSGDITARYLLAGALLRLEKPVDCCRHMEEAAC